MELLRHREFAEFGSSTLFSTGCKSVGRCILTLVQTLIAGRRLPKVIDDRSPFGSQGCQKGLLSLAPLARSVFGEAPARNGESSCEYLIRVTVFPSLLRPRRPLPD